MKPISIEEALADAIAGYLARIHPGTRWSVEIGPKIDDENEEEKTRPAAFPIPDKRATAGRDKERE